MSCSALPEGWKREESKRSGGLSSSKTEVCYISPSGKKIKTKAELAQYLGNLVDLTTFDFKTGKINAALMRRNKRPIRTGLYDYRSLKHDQSLAPPVRQNPWLSKKPVKVLASHPGSTVYNSQQIREYYKKNNMTVSSEPKSDPAEKPYQLFWQKRLQGMRASINGDDFQDFELPANMKAFMLTLGDKDTLLRSVTASLHQNVQPVRGQDKHALQKKKKDSGEDAGRSSPRNPVAFVNPHQPLILSTTVTEDDIRRQEEIVAEARLKLKSAIADLL